MTFAKLAACALPFTLLGCATFENGAIDQVHVLSDPPGATVTVSYAEISCTTPCTLDVPRALAFTVAVEKDGYVTENAEVKTSSTAPASATSRDITPDYIGRVVDVQISAANVHVPNPVVFTLKKAAEDESQPAPVPRRDKRPGQAAETGR